MDTFYDSATRTLICGTEKCFLPQGAGELLSLFLLHEGTLLSRERAFAALHGVWGIVVDGRSMDVAVWRLRGFLRSVSSGWGIRTVRGAGWVMDRGKGMNAGG